MPGQRNLCVKILETLQDNEHRQSILRTKLIFENPLTVVVLRFKFFSDPFVASGEALCNGEDQFSKEEGYIIASKRAARKLADNRQAREIIAEFEYLIEAWS